jgi:hypothetical protein
MNWIVKSIGAALWTTFLVPAHLLDHSVAVLSRHRRSGVPRSPGSHFASHWRGLFVEGPREARVNSLASYPVAKRARSSGALRKGSAGDGEHTRREKPGIRGSTMRVKRIPAYPLCRVMRSVYFEIPRIVPVSGETVSKALRIRLGARCAVLGASRREPLGKYLF